MSLTSPPHARLQTHANGATPKPKPPGWWLGRFQPTHAPTQAPYPIALSSFCVFTFVTLDILVCITCYFTQQEVTARVFMPLFECPSKRCNVNRAKGNLILQLRASKFLKFQEAKLQELSEHVPKGHIPRTMTVHFRGELTRKVSPGDVVELSGIFLPIPYTGFRAMRAGLVADTYLEAMSISHFKKKYEE
ncbi:putative DNA helicase [Helianthus anomalus]